jgi:hypothetical protein
MSDTEAQGLIDSARFRETMTEQQERAKASPEGRRLVQRAKIRLLENQLQEATVGEFTILCDEAVTRRGDGKAPSPLQYSVAAIGF